MDYQRYIKEKTLTSDFAAYIGIQLIEMSEGYAKAEIDLDERHQNPIGSIHGGVFFSLADVTGGAAAVSHGFRVATLDSSFHFLRPGIGTKKLSATARELKYGKKVSVYDVSITDENDEVLAEGIFTYMSLNQKFFED